MEGFFYLGTYFKVYWNGHFYTAFKPILGGGGGGGWIVESTPINIHE